MLIELVCFVDKLSLILYTENCVSLRAAGTTCTDDDADEEEDMHVCVCFLGC